MSLDKNNKNTFWFYDDINHMMIHQNFGPVFDNGKHDGPEKACHAYYAYKDNLVSHGVQKCKDWVPRKNWILRKLFGKQYIQWKRYPKLEWYHEPISRDHWIYIFVLLVKVGYVKYFIGHYVRNTRIQLSRTNWLTPKVWLWGKLISGEKIGYLFYPIALISIIQNKYWNKIIDKIGNFGEEWSQSDWIHKKHPEPTKFQKFLRQFRYPTYALKLVAFMLDVLPDNWFKRQIHRQSWDMIPRYNYVLKIMLNHPNPPTFRQVRNYKSIKGDRWSDTLNPLLTPRALEVIRDPKLLAANRLDYDLLVALYDERIINKKLNKNDGKV